MEPTITYLEDDNVYLITTYLVSEEVWNYLAEENAKKGLLDIKAQCEFITKTQKQHYVTPEELAQFHVKRKWEKVA